MYGGRFNRRKERFGKFRIERGRRDFGEKPVKVGEEYDVEITEIGSRGDGIARIKNFVIFVPDTEKGEKVKVKVNEVRGRFATGEKIDVVEKKSEE